MSVDLDSMNRKQLIQLASGTYKHPVTKLGQVSNDAIRDLIRASQQRSSVRPQDFWQSHAAPEYDEKHGDDTKVRTPRRSPSARPHPSVRPHGSGVTQPVQQEPSGPVKVNTAHLHQATNFGRCYVQFKNLLANRQKCQKVFEQMKRNQDALPGKQDSADQEFWSNVVAQFNVTGPKSQGQLMALFNAMRDDLSSRKQNAVQMLHGVPEEVSGPIMAKWQARVAPDELKLRECAKAIGVQMN